MNPKANPKPAPETRTKDRSFAPAPGVTESSPPRVQSWLLALLLVAATILAYQPAWNAGFIWDDDDYVTHNPLLTAPDGLKRIWFSLDSPSQYFPLTYTTFRLERALWGLNPSGFHWVNILLHAVNALLVWRLLKRLDVPGAWLAAAIFALHPVQVESVAWISELKNVQSLFFFLLALLAWVEFVKESSSWTWYFLAIVLHSLALFSKTTACVLPAALLLVLWLKQKPIHWRHIAQVVPFVVLGLAMGVVSMWWERHHQGTVGEVYALGPLERLLVASRALWFYLGKLLWPADLTFNYPLWKINPASPLAYAGLIAGLGLCAAIYFLRRSAGRSIETAAVFFVATLSPLLGFIMLYTFRYTFVTDHYQYVAMIGPVALAAAGITLALNRFEVPANSTRPAPSRSLSTSAPRLNLTGPRSVLCGALVLVLGVLTWRQARMYENLETLWRTTVRKNPASFMGHNNLGVILLGKGRTDDAIAHFRQALEILPRNANAHGNLGNALLRKGLAEPALGHFQQALDIEPNAKAHSDLAYCLLQTGRMTGALEHSAKAVELQPDFAEAHNNRGVVLLQTGHLDDAIREFRSTLDLQPEYTDARYNLAITLFRRGQVPESIIHFQKLVETQPDNAELHNNLGWALLQDGRVDDAIARFETVLKLQPGFVMAHNNLAIAFLQKGQAAEAAAQYQSFLNAQPDHEQVLSELAWVLATWPDASVRNGRRAMDLAHRANRLSGGRNPRILRTLAAAQAENAQFAEAIANAERALQLAESDPVLSAAIQAQIQSYQSGTAFRDPGGAEKHASQR